MQSPFLSIIIPTYNRAEKLDRCLQALRTQENTAEPFEVLVVDDGSTDTTPLLLKKWAEEWNSLRIFEQKNAGQGNARNKALKEAHGEVILFLGDDIYASEHFLKTHIRFHKKHPEKETACLGLTEWEMSGKINSYMKWLTHGGPQFAYYKLVPGETTSYWFFYTSNISLKKALLKEDQFDPAFNAYGWEDIELGYRLMQKGLKLIYVPEALAYHDHFMEEKNLKERMFNIGRSALIFEKKQAAVPVVPKGLKYLALSLISSWPIINIFRILKNISPSFFQEKYWYLLSKRYFLQGARRI